MSIRWKILIPMVAASVVTATIIGLLGILVVNLFVADFNDRQLLTAKVLSTTIMEQDRNDAARSSAMVAENERMIDTLSAYWQGGEREELVDASVSLMKATGVDFLTVMDNDGNVIVRAHEPDNFGDSLANQQNVKRAMRGDQYTTTEKGSAVKLSVRSGSPIYDYNGVQIGVVSLGFRLDQNSFVDYVKKLTNAEVTVFLGDTRVSTTLVKANGDRAINTQALDNVSKKVLSGEDYIGVVDVMGTPLYSSYSPITDAEGEILGMLFVGIDTSPVDNRMKQDVFIMIAVIVTLGFVALWLSLKISGKIVRSLRETSDVAKRLAVGDVDVNVELPANMETKDETAQLAIAFQEMIEANRERARVIEDVAGGDLADEVAVKSDKDVVGLALTDLLDRNNAAFAEMANAARQLDAASKQIADGSQNLAQGSGEQAHTIERLNLALKELSHRTTEKTGQAKQAARLSDSVKNSAERGNRHMTQMMEAVGQISQASEAIEKVIKVIDDIAFQTNILALNAAVEAAHAGQYGKGFAVVADEVRILAAKSAEAARDTGDLIANSIEKARLGAQISKETAAAFSEIVVGVKDTSEIVEEIADFMQSQNDELENVSKGVDDIGHIVQSISASAEESAASSQEMSAQATSMAAILAGYHLRENADKSLNDGRRGAKKQIQSPHY